MGFLDKYYLPGERTSNNNNGWNPNSNGNPPNNDWSNNNNGNSPNNNWNNNGNSSNDRNPSNNQSPNQPSTLPQDWVITALNQTNDKNAFGFMDLLPSGVVNPFNQSRWGQAFSECDWKGWYKLGSETHQFLLQNATQSSTYQPSKEVEAMSVATAVSEDPSQFMGFLPSDLKAKQPQNPIDVCNWKAWFKLGWDIVVYSGNGSNANQNPCTFHWNIPPGNIYVATSKFQANVVVTINIPTLGSTILRSGNWPNDPNGVYDHNFGYLSSNQLAEINLSMNGQPTCLKFANNVNNGNVLDAVGYEGKQQILLRWGPA